VDDAAAASDAGERQRLAHHADEVVVAGGRVAAQQHARDVERDLDGELRALAAALLERLGRAIERTGGAPALAALASAMPRS
jgi:hypothetical protein